MAFRDEEETPEHEEAELVKKERAVVEEEEAPVVPEEEEEVAEYHPVKVELVEVLLEAVDILERVARGELDLNKARALYAEKVELPSSQMVAESPARGKKKEAKKKATAKRSSTKKSSKSSKRKSSKSKKKSESSKES